LRVRHHGYYIADVGSVAELDRLGRDTLILAAYGVTAAAPGDDARHQAEGNGDQQQRQRDRDEPGPGCGGVGQLV
jgi:hypothetical protein